MEVLISVFVFIFGTIIGSFLNVVVYRYNTGFSLGGRSQCASCAKILAWYELVPVVSFLLQKRRCIGCKAKISWQYPVVEVSTGILFLLTYNLYSIPYTALPYYWVVMSLLVVITVYDLKHKIIPDLFVYSFIVLAFLNLFRISDFGFRILDQWDLLAGPILAAPFVLIWLVSRGKWMGLGDGKLVLGLGWFLGLYQGISAVILAFWIGAVVGILLLFLKGKTFTMKSEIPFGPFLILGMLLVFFFQVDIFSLLSL